jgi:hypothetical protein
MKHFERLGSRGQAMKRNNLIDRYSEASSTPGAFELGNSQKISTMKNRIDYLKLRIDLLDEVARILLEGQDYNDGDFLKWFRSKKEGLTKTQRSH